jgi:hypothetical protein
VTTSRPTRGRAQPKRENPPAEPAEPEAGIGNPVFFLSYARTRSSGSVETSGDTNTEVGLFFKDLRKRVANLVAVDPGHEIGFQDTEMRTGELWNPELVRNVGSCHVFVALLSEHLIRSDWCAMEWDLFSRRTVRPRPGKGPRFSHPTGIIPVHWAPMRHTPPPVVHQVQRFKPTGINHDQFAKYQTEGVLGLLDVDIEAYRAVLWTLAKVIQEACDALEVEPSDLTDTSQLRRSFEGSWS